MAGSAIRPIRELKWFQKVTLDPGEARTIVFRIDEPMFRFVRRDMTIGSEPGRFEVYIGGSSETENKGSFMLIRE